MSNIKASATSGSTAAASGSSSGPGESQELAEPGSRLGESPEPAERGPRAGDAEDRADAMFAAIERSGYYPGVVSEAVSAAISAEPVVAYLVHHDAVFDPGMEVRRHMTVLAMTPTRLVYSHTDEQPGDDEDTRPQAETTTEAVRFSQVSSVALSRVVPDPASYVPGATMPSEVVLTIGWNVLSHIELEPAHCGDENCDADHGYTGTLTADDLTVRLSEAADGEEAVRQLLAFAQALAQATSRP
jgi:hypothetical protein